MMLRSSPLSRGPSVRTSHCCHWTPGPWGGCSPRSPPGPRNLHRCDWPGSGADCPDPRVLIGVAQTDWLLLRRQGRRLLQMGVGLAIAVLPFLSGAVR